MKYITFLLYSFLAISCSQETSGDSPSETKAGLTENELRLSDEQLNTMDISFDTLKKHQMPGILRLNGKISVSPNDKISLSSALGGHITSVNALPGKSVRKGDMILTLEDQQFIQIQQDYLTTRAQLLSAEPNYLRQKELNSSKSISDKVMQQAETNYRSLLAIQRGLEEKLRLLNIDPSELNPDNIKRSITISAPFNGVISEVFVNKGKYVSPSDILVELINPKGMLLNLTVFEKDLSKIKVGQSVEAYTNDNPDQKIQAKVITRGTHINENGNSVITAQLIENSYTHLADGLYINARIIVENTEVYSVHSDAVVSFEGKNYVFERAGKNEFRLQEIDIVESDNEWTEVKDFHHLLGKKIVTKGAYGLLMALKNKMEE